MNQALLALVILAAPLTGQDYARLRKLMVGLRSRRAACAIPKCWLRCAPYPGICSCHLGFAPLPTTTGGCPSAYGRTISQPAIVAVMTELLEPHRDHRALEVGTGSGYQAALLSRLAKQVYTIEIIATLAPGGGQRPFTPYAAHLMVYLPGCRSADAYLFPQEARRRTTAI
jgi:hypothetical protein